MRKKREGLERYSAKRILTAAELEENKASSSLSNLIFPDGQVALFNGVSSRTSWMVLSGKYLFRSSALNAVWTTGRYK